MIWKWSAWTGQALRLDREHCQPTVSDLLCVAIAKYPMGLQDMLPKVVIRALMQNSPITETAKNFLYLKSLLIAAVILSIQPTSRHTRNRTTPITIPIPSASAVEFIIYLLVNFQNKSSQTGTTQNSWYLLTCSNKTLFSPHTNGLTAKNTGT